MHRNILAALFTITVAAGCATSSSRGEPVVDVKKVSQPEDAFLKRNYAKADAAVDCARTNRTACPPPIVPLAGR